jgi:di/tricarboxylate transporter
MLPLLSLLPLLVLLIWNRWTPQKVFAGWLLGALLLQWTTPEQALRNFASPQLATVLLLVLLSQVLERMSWLEVLARALGRFALREQLWRMSLGAALLSGFVNNSAVVAAWMGPLLRQQRQHARSLLLPLSYASVLGGTLTLIGTSTNLIVSGLAEQSGLPALRFGDFWLVGLPVVLVGVALLALLTPRLLAPATTDPNARRPLHELGAVVQPQSPLCGKSVEANGLRHLQQLFLVEIVRGEEHLRPVRPQEVIQAKDTLLFTGDIEQVQELRNFEGLELLSGHLRPNDRDIREVVISPSSILVGRTLKEVEFRSRFDAGVLSIRRGDTALHGKLGAQRLQPGDELVLVTGPDFLRRNNLDRNFLLLQSTTLRKPLQTQENLALGGGFVLVLSLSMLQVLPLLTGLLSLLAVSTALGWIGTDQIRRRFPFDLLVIIGTALTISQVLRATETLPLLIAQLQQLPLLATPLGGLVFCFGIAWLLTELITNNGAAALAFPFALQTAEALQADPFPYLLALAFGASASFLSPYGYQTHLMVRAPGGYQFQDFLRLGFPLLVAYATTAVGMLWLLYL